MIIETILTQDMKSAFSSVHACFGLMRPCRYAVFRRRLDRARTPHRSFCNLTYLFPFAYFMLHLFAFVMVQ